MPQPSSVDARIAAPPVSRAEVEDFLYAEAALLDEWRLDEWLALFTEDGTYHVPSTDEPDGDPGSTLFDRRRRVAPALARRTAERQDHVVGESPLAHPADHRQRPISGGRR